jgi:LysR family transcriptional regulator, carnitine catabolism transcriptional activator
MRTKTRRQPTNELSLPKLKSFVAVAQTLQFRQAAEAVGVSQATLSAHVRDLEGNLGVLLLSRTTRKVRLTAEGERFYDRARKVLEDLGGAVSDVREQAELRRGRLIIATISSVASNVLPPVLASFHSRYPGITVQVIEDGTTAVEQRVADGNADFGVGLEPREHTDLSFRLMFRDRLVAVVGNGHPLSRRVRVRLNQLLAYPLLRSMPEISVRRSLEAIARERGLELRTEHLLSHDRGTPQTVVAMVAAGLGVALLPSLALAMLDRQKIAVLDIIDPELSRDVGILERKGGSTSTAAREFLQLWSGNAARRHESQR